MESALSRVLLPSLVLCLSGATAIAQSCPTNDLPVGWGLRNASDNSGPFFENKQQADDYFESYWRTSFTAILATSQGVICHIVLDPDGDDDHQVGRLIKIAYPGLDENNVLQPADCSLSWPDQVLQAPLVDSLLCRTGYELTLGTFNGVPGTSYCKKKSAAIAHCPLEPHGDETRGGCPAGPVGSSMEGNPCNAATGNKFQLEVDYTGPNGLRFARYYNSDTATPTGTIGKLWRSEYDRRLEFPAFSGTGYKYNYGSPRVYAHRPDGQVIWFTFDGNSATPVRAGTAEKLLRIDSETWELLTAHGTRERYVLRANASGSTSFGRLEKITFRGGQTLTLTYSAAERVGTVKDSFGKTLTFTYASGRVSAVTDPSGNKILYQYNSAGYLSAAIYPDNTPTNANDNPRKLYNYADTANVGALTSITDEAGATYAHWVYDTSRRATLSEHAGGADQVTLTYNGSGTTTVGYASGATATHSFATIESLPHTTGVQGAAGLDSRVYYASGYLAQRTDRNGNTTTFDVDDRGFETSRTEGLGSPNARTISTTWDATLDVPTSIAQGNRLATFTYDSAGNALTKTITDSSVTPAVSRTWTNTYNALGQVLSEDGPRTDVSDLTTYTYYTCSTGSQCGQINSITNPLGHTTTFNSYDTHGRVTKFTDANGLVTSLAYDLRQRLTDRCVGSTLPGCSGGELTHLDYWSTGLLKKVANPDASYIEYTYDAAHRLTQINDGAANKIVYTLDNAGNRTAEKSYDPSGMLRRTHTRVFNSLNQLWKDVNAASTAAVTTVFGYDSNGNQTTINAPLSRNSTSLYDEFNRLKQITDPASGVTQFGYDENDNLTSVTDPRSLVTSYTYTGFGDLRTQTSPDTGVTINSYDTAGNLDTSTDSRGAITHYGYDAANRVTSASFTLGGVTDQTLAYVYDAGTNQKGRLTSASDANHSISWTYDKHGRITNKEQTVGGITLSMGYGYNSAGRHSSTVLPSGAIIGFGYNTNGQMTSVTLNGSTTLLNAITYDPFGPITGWTWGNGTTASRAFDNDGKVTQVDNAAGASLKVYTYDDAFRITGISDAGNSALSWIYGYDQLDRLSSATKTGTTQGWNYDANGNRLSETGTAPSTYTNSGASNRVSSISGSLARTYAYDSVGNTLSYAGATFAYYNSGRMASATNGGVSATYTYNALGQRIKRTASGVTTLYAYDEEGHLAGEYTSTGLLIQETVWLGDMPVATLRPNGSGGVIVYYVHADHLNTPRLVTDASNNIRWRWDSDPFGSTQPNENPASLGVFVYNLRFPGQQFDPIVGLHYNYFRDYDPATGRYDESDPIGLHGGLNTYAYAGGNPVADLDPLGLAPPRGRSAPNTYPPGPFDFPNPFSPANRDWARNAAQQIEDAFNNAVNAISGDEGGLATTPPPYTHADENDALYFPIDPFGGDEFCKNLRRAINILRTMIDWRRSDLNPASPSYRGHIQRITILRSALARLQEAYRNICGGECPAP